MRGSRLTLIAVTVLAAMAAAGCGGGGGAGKAAAADAPRASQTPVARQFTIMVDQKRTQASSAGTTVRDVLASAGIELGPHDLVTPALDQPAGDVIKVTRLLSKPVTKNVVMPPRTIEKKSAKIAAWGKKVVRPGKPGLKVVKMALVMRRGKKVKAVVAQTVKRKPVAEIVQVGPKPSSVGGPASRLNWRALANCESHGNPKAVNSAGYYGLYQFSLASWATVGGTGRPTDASAAEQTYRAQLLYNRVNGRWQGQWPNCGRFL